MRIYQPSSDDDFSTPSSANVREFARRRQAEREDTGRRPQIDEDAWSWFLSLFAAQRESEGRSSHRAA